MTLGVLGCLAAPGTASTGAVFSYTGGEQVYTVPAGVTVVHVAATGAPGAPGASSNNGAAPGGTGAQVQGDLPVTPGEQLFVEVGGASGWGGGGASRNGGGNGGGASDVRTCSLAASSCSATNDTLTTRLLVAAGGGGGGAPDTGTQHPGGAGGAAGEAGSFDAPPPRPADDGGPGNPGTASGGGDVSQEMNIPAAGSPGAFGRGGDTSSVAGEGGGGGGGGWFGGAAGGTGTNGTPGGGGGGGSSYATPGAHNVSVQIASTDVPSISITPLYPALAVSAQSVAFSARQTGTESGAQTLTITNSGQAPLYVTGLALSGANPQDFAISSTTCGAALAPGGTCQVAARFVPQSGGVRRASLVVSAEGLGDQTVALLGTATAPPPAPPVGIEACSGRQHPRTCTITFSAAALGLPPRARVTSFTLRRSGRAFVGTASTNGRALQLRRRGSVTAGRYALTLWKIRHKHRHRVRTLTVRIM